MPSNHTAIAFASLQNVAHTLADAETQLQAAVREARAAALSLERWFGTPFAVFDPSGGVLRVAVVDGPKVDWACRGAVLAHACQLGRATLIEEEDPIAALAVPLRVNDEMNWIGVALVATRNVMSEAELSRAAEVFQRPTEELWQWAATTKATDASALERMADLAMAKLAADRRIEQLENEVDQLSQRIGATYEELSLIYRLTQNLKVSGSREDLAELALEWLGDVLPAECMVVRFTDVERRGIPGAPESRSLITAGRCPLSAEELDELFDELSHEAKFRPLVLNQSATNSDEWRFRNVREIVVVPIAEGSSTFGWMAIFNHTQGSEFGTSEASLLSSIGTMLGIHAANASLYRQQSETLADVVRAMSSAIDAKDPYTRGHSERVARVSVRLAQELGCDTETVKTLYLSGLLHDIGKIGVNDDVLRKPGRLTEPEFEHVKAHVTIGYRILKDLRKMQHMLPVVLHHHESIDGNGYPHGLKGEEIPWLARIVAVADAFDAMTSDRPYRAGMPIDKVDAVIRRGGGIQWDAQVVEAYFRCRDDLEAIINREVDESDLVQLQWT